MIQALDLARENAALKDEVDRLRREVAELGQTNGVWPPGSLTTQWPHQSDTDHPVRADLGTMGRVMMIMPRDRASDYRSLAGRFAGVPDCRVIVDRRLMERRRGQRGHPDDERRRGDRRSKNLDTPDALVVSLR